jgi:undecaprenyl-diphosphatase
MESIEALDLGSIFAIGSFQQKTPWLIPVFEGLALVGSFFGMALVAGLATLGFVLFRRLLRGGVVLLVFLVCAVACQTVQPLIGRPRPDISTVVPGRPYGHGFPNGEAAVSAATFALLLLMLLRLLKSRVLQGLLSSTVVALVLAIGFSQMYLAWGYLSDVIGGWALGLSLALFLRWFDLRWNRPEKRVEMSV